LRLVISTWPKLSEEERNQIFTIITKNK